MRLRAPLTLLALASVVTAGVALNAGTAYAAAPVLDGSTRALAAESCYAIKQVAPAKPSGVYWLQTSKLVTAQQFYCDQDTDGGGWVLIGRGREGWAFTQRGQGSPATLRSTISGPAAFAPAALPADTIDGLLDGASMAGLADGIRVRRATNAAGTAYQEMRLKLAPLATGSTQWSWAFGGGHKLASVTMDGTASTIANQNTRDLTLAGGNGHHPALHLRVVGPRVPGRLVVRAVGGRQQLGRKLPLAGHDRAARRPVLPGLAASTAGQQRLPGRTGDRHPRRAEAPLMSTTTSNTTPWGVTGVVGGGTGETNLEVAGAHPARPHHVRRRQVRVRPEGTEPRPARRSPSRTSRRSTPTPGSGSRASGRSSTARSGTSRPPGRVPDRGRRVLQRQRRARHPRPAKLDPNTGAVVASWKASLTYGAQPTRSRHGSRHPGRLALRRRRLHLRHRRGGRSAHRQAAQRDPGEAVRRLPPTGHGSRASTRP